MSFIIGTVPLKSGQLDSQASMRVESDMSDDEDEVMIQDSGPVASPTNVTTDVESRYPIRNRRPTVDTDRISTNFEHRYIIPYMYPKYHLKKKGLTIHYVIHNYVTHT